MNEYQLDPSNYPPKWNRKDGHIKIVVSSEINSSESNEKVLKAVANIFPNLNPLVKNDNMVEGTSNDESILVNLCNLIFEQKILDVARKCALDGIIYNSNGESTNKTIFFLNKQIAYINKLNFSAQNDSPLGPISISIECQNLNLFIDTYFPKFEWFIIKKH